MAAEYMKRAFRLNSGVVKDELPSTTELIPLARLNHAPAEWVPLSAAAFSEDIAENV